MKKEVFETVKKELKILAIIFLIALIAFKIAFFREDFIVVLRIVLSLFWIFVIPGYFVMLYWKEKIDFLERIIAGIFLSAAIIGISSYYIGIIGLNLKFHFIMLPLFMLIISIVALLYSSKNNI